MKGRWGYRDGGEIERRFSEERMEVERMGIKMHDIGYDGRE
jgi:hypothetical protein